MAAAIGGTLSIPGVSIGFLDKIPFGAAMNRCTALTTALMCGCLSCSSTYTPRSDNKLQT